MALGVILHYPQQILSFSSPSLFSSIGLTRHAVERIYLLIPITYASYFIGTPGGLITLAVASAIMLPRVFLLSDYMPDALFETMEIIAVGVVINWWFARYRKEKKERQVMLSSMEIANKELQRYTSALEEDERRLVAINQVSKTTSQSLELNRVLDNAIATVIDSVQVDAAWIYLLSEDRTELVLAAHHGFSEEYARIAGGPGNQWQGDCHRSARAGGRCVDRRAFA